MIHVLHVCTSKMPKPINNIKPFDAPSAGAPTFADHCYIKSYTK